MRESYTQRDSGLSIEKGRTIGMIETPVILLVFNRPTQTRAVFRSIADAQPRRLLIVADGPRDTRPDDKQLCEEVLGIVQNINWPCEVSTNFSPTNLGCRHRVITGLDWAFSLVEEAIILEDDCLPHPDFFRFCVETLNRYRGDSRIGSISGSNLDPPNRRTPYSYYFSQIGGNWGWATWRAAWQKYDPQMLHWKAIRESAVLSEVWTNQATLQYWTNIFESMYNDTGPDTWDYQWVYTRLIHNMLSIVPCVNMVRNIGFGPDATHTFDIPQWVHGLVENPIQFPLKHPPHFLPMRSFDALDQKIAFLEPSIPRKLFRKARTMGQLFKESVLRADLSLMGKH